MKNIELNVKTSDFEGPFELFLHLIENKKIDISKVFISKILDDYLQIIEKEQNENLKIKVEFLEIASELLEIKAYSILNVEKKKEKEESLEKRIFEYKIIKEISEEFSKREVEFNIPYIVRGKNTKSHENIFYSLDELKIETIRNVFKEFILRSNREERLKISLIDTFTTEMALFEIEKSLTIENEIKFSNLLEGDFSKSRIVSFFLAILDLFKTGKIDIIELENDFYIRKEENA